MSAEALIRHWREQVGAAALPFEARWTRLALRRASPSIAKALHEQLGLFDQACFTGERGEVETHGAAMCRGYAAAVKALTEAGAEDDAYQMGADPVSGLKVAIGSQRAAVDRVRTLHGQDVIWITPDEIAVLLASVEAFKFVGAVKQFFPGAEIVRRYADQGT